MGFYYTTYILYFQTTVFLDHKVKVTEFGRGKYSCYIAHPGAIPDTIRVRQREQLQMS